VYTESWPITPQKLIADKIEHAFEQFERGDFLTSEESRAYMEERKAVWLREAGLNPTSGTA